MAPPSPKLRGAGTTVRVEVLWASLQNYRGLHRNLRDQRRRKQRSKTKRKNHALQPLGHSQKMLRLQGKGLSDRRTRM